MIVRIPLGQGLFAILDEPDAGRAAALDWGPLRGRKTVYARSGNVLLHRFVMQPEQGMVVDHIDGDGLNNARSNLRVCTPMQNHANARKHTNSSSYFKGVYRHRRRWRAQIIVDKERVALGSFETQTRAAMAYDKAARFYFGQFAMTNADMGLFEKYPVA